MSIINCFFIKFRDLSKNLLCELLKLIVILVLQDNLIDSFFKENNYFELIYKITLNYCNNSSEFCFKLINLLINGATDGEYYFVLQKYLFANPNDILKSYEKSFSFLTKYIEISHPKFLIILLNIIFLGCDKISVEIKNFVLYFIEKLMQNSDYNINRLASEDILEIIVIFHRAEFNQEVRKSLENIVYYVLHSRVRVKEIKVIF